MIKIIDKITESVAYLAAWMFFSIGAMITYEVVMRKVFNLPTIWVDEVTRFVQVWAVYLASAHILKMRALITVELFTSSLSKGKFKVLEIFSLLVIAFFSFVRDFSLVFMGIRRTCGHAITPCDSLSALLTVPCCTIDHLHSSRP